MGSGGICGMSAGNTSEGLLIEYCWNEGKYQDSIQEVYVECLLDIIRAM